MAPASDFFVVISGDGEGFTLDVEEKVLLMGKLRLRCYYIFFFFFFLLSIQKTSLPRVRGNVFFDVLQINVVSLLVVFML